MQYLQVILALALAHLLVALPTHVGKYDVLGKKTSDGKTRFLIIGDWGGLPFFPYTTPSEVAVARAMGNLGEKLNTSFQLALGDNFYYEGVKSVDDPRFQETFEKVFTASSLHTPWYPLAGNHDHLGNVSAQIAYSKISKRWTYPDYFYTFTLWSNDGKNKLVDFVMIDTVILCGGGNISDSSDAQMNGPKDIHLAETSWDWVEQQLSQSTAPYLLVSGHFPVYSVAEHGPTKCLVDRLRPLLHQYHATAYMCGHDHNLQHLTDQINGTVMNYFVVGAGDIAENSRKHASDVPVDSLKYFWAEGLILGGFGMIDVDNTEMTFSFIEYSEKTLYQTRLSPRST